ncbi:uncharacterized protein M421DRAFT_305654 [Didymella exigua CBS 183.55]|uniref:Uncharacterized protein n=1 Tax=Didymella exigua CBS 183.55 TaxID=1150837 RepID=A0A6A5R961_9PLEO|nr:uncharacterized protein M421DRAFT_305654 [Didymella exigua CBS 183.55]KAF1923780.1 hypothetical protein M421DRAFT_305654 [Didymella exigua CBS 183.55]
MRHASHTVSFIRCMESAFIFELLLASARSCADRWHWQALVHHRHLHGLRVGVKGTWSWNAHGLHGVYDRLVAFVRDGCMAGWVSEQQLRAGLAKRSGMCMA